MCFLGSNGEIKISLFDLATAASATTCNTGASSGATTGASSGLIIYCTYNLKGCSLTVPLRADKDLSKLVFLVVLL